ncbi:30S ribosomal protein S21, chloroplastic [Glycine soja]
MQPIETLTSLPRPPLSPSRQREREAVMSSPLHCCSPQRYRTPPATARASASTSARAIGIDNDSSVKSILYHALSLSNILHFNVQIVVGEDELEDRIINHFKKEVLKAGVLQECKHRRFSENKDDKIKRKAREASRRNRKRKPPSRAWVQNKHDSEKKKKDDVDDDIDDLELPRVDIPYT